MRYLSTISLKYYFYIEKGVCWWWSWLAVGCKTSFSTTKVCLSNLICYLFFFSFADLCFYASRSNLATSNVANNNDNNNEDNNQNNNQNNNNNNQNNNNQNNQNNNKDRLNRSAAFGFIRNRAPKSVVFSPHNRVNEAVSIVSSSAS